MQQILVQFLGSLDSLQSLVGMFSEVKAGVTPEHLGETQNPKPDKANVYTMIPFCAK